MTDKIGEYLLTFSSEGPYLVKVKFVGHPGRIAQRHMEAHDVMELIDPLTGLFARRMTFDEHPFEIVKYEIDPIKMVLVIQARPLRDSEG